MTTALGTQFPYDAGPAGQLDQVGHAPESTWQALRALQPEVLVIPSHTDHSNLDRLAREFPDCAWFIRVKTGVRNRGVYPDEILDWREWVGTPSLGDTVEKGRSLGRRLAVMYGNEPDIELTREPVDDDSNRADAIAFYNGWFLTEVGKFRRRFPDVALAPAPLSQGNPARWESWLEPWLRWVSVSDFAPEHCYTNGMAHNEPDWGGRWRVLDRRLADIRSATGRLLPIDITEANDNGAFGDDWGWRRRDLIDWACSVARTTRVRSIATFTVEGSVRDPEHPSWWHLPPDLLSDLRGQFDIARDDPDPQPKPDPDPQPDPEPDPQPDPVPENMNEDQAFRWALETRWRLMVRGLAYNPEAAMVKTWLSKPEIGSPIADAQEVRDADNNVTLVVQPFSNATLFWRPGMERADVFIV